MTKELPNAIFVLRQHGRSVKPFLTTFYNECILIDYFPSHFSNFLVECQTTICIYSLLERVTYYSTV